MTTNDWKPTAKLRFVKREVITGTLIGAIPTTRTERILQQWYAHDMPAYMRGSDGEWRDVEFEPGAT